MSDVMTPECWLAVAALLAGYLCYRQCDRALGRAERLNPAEWTGKAIDVTGLREKLDQVRRDYLGAIRNRSRGVCFHKALLGWARHAISRMRYFRDIAR